MANPFEGLWLPISKSEESVHGETHRIIHGIASTEDRDSQGETLLAKGIDFNPFLENGFFNWNHQHQPEDLVGEPWEARLVTNEYGVKGTGLLVKGRLYDDMPRADYIWKLMQQMEKGASRRRMGFSVEGLCQKAGGVIVKSIVEHVAVTHQPVNGSTWAQIAKSLVKAMTTGDAVALRTEDLYSAANASDRLFHGPCTCGERDDQGNFRNGRQGAITHLVKCCGMNGDQAAQTMIRLKRSRVLA